MSEQKKVIARSRALYRNVEIMETESGCSIVLNGKQFDCKDLNEAVGLIEAAAAKAVRMMLTGAHWVGSEENQLPS